MQLLLAGDRTMQCILKKRGSIYSMLDVVCYQKVCISLDFKVCGQRTTS